ncbi:MAG: hypothetical protein ACFFDW_09545, partial [Candidatus Thorarchaeota archaeon]
VVYNPITQKVSISWIDLLYPDTPSAYSSIYYSIGNSSISWSSPTIVESVSDTIKLGYNPTPDKNESLHFIFEEYSVDNFELQEIIIKNDTTVLPKIALTINSGDSTDPITISDQNGIVHLVWRDTTVNSNGDLYYNFYNATTGLWDSASIITSSAEVSANSPASITVDENNTLHLVWSDKRSSDQELYYSYKEIGSAWSIAEKITNAAYKPIKPIISYNNITKRIGVIFRDNESTNNLYYMSAFTKAIGSEWSSPISINSYLASDSDYNLCTDSFGNSIVVFETLIGGYHRIYLKQRSAFGTWSSEKLVSSTMINAYDPSITIDGNGQYYIIYTEKYLQATEVYIVNGFVDSDDDGLSDLDEINIYNTNPLLADSDGDTISDGDEVLIFSTNPLDDDSDNDLMPDNFEIQYGFNPNSNTDASLDYDEDGLTNLEEYQEGTNPTSSDSDGDSISDGAEVKTYFTDPLNTDSDSDGLSDGYEIHWGLDPNVWDDGTKDPDGDGLTTNFESYIWTNPLNADTDGDGFSDGIEVNRGTDPLDPNDFPTNINTPKEYGTLITIIIVSIGIVALFSLFAVFMAQQFRPRESKKRKELEREENKLAISSKGGKSSWEEKERQQVEMITRRRAATLLGEDEIIPSRTKEIQEEVIEEDEEGEYIDAEKFIEEGSDSPVTRIPTKIDNQNVSALLNEKNKQMEKFKKELEKYEQQLDDILRKKMTAYNLSTFSREGLTELATESQRIYSEAKTYWSNNVLPLIKGYENEFYTDTLEIEKIIDNCESTANQILDILVKRELDYTSDEARKESIKDKAKLALEQKKEKNDDKKEDKEI